MNASGPTIAPMLMGAAGSRTWRGTNGDRKASTCSAVATSTRSWAWVSTKPSMQTITGTDSSSARANAWTCRSAASWLDAACSWIQPQSRWDITSLWSFQMLIGAPIARLATVMTIGSPRPAALYTASAMYSNPWLAVAVYVRAPVAEAPMHTDIAPNSDSTLRYSQPVSSPAATMRASPSTMCVCGEIG